MSSKEREPQDDRVSSAERGVCLVKIGGRILWSGYNATGDPKLGAYWMRVDVAGEHYLTGVGGLVVPRVSKSATFTPEGLALAAKLGMFGFRVIEGANDRPGGEGPRNVTEARRRNKKGKE